MSPAGAEAFFAGIETVPALIDKRATMTPDSTAFFEQTGQGQWKPVTWSQFRSNTYDIAAFFSQLGLAHGERLAILSATCLDWEICQIAAMRVGLAVVGIDPYYPAEQVNRILAQLQPAALVVGDDSLLQRLSAEVRAAIRVVITMGARPAADNIVCLHDAKLDVQPNSEAQAQAAVAGADAAIVVFSSGTTGIPKPIAYTHAQVCLACRSILEAYEDIEEGCTLICWMPLANLFQRIINFCAAAKGASTYVVIDPRWVMECVPIANPRIFVAVPRFCERLYYGIQEQVAKLPSVLRYVVQGALAVNALAHSLRTAARPVPLATRTAAAVARATVIRRLRNVMGSNIRYIVSGSAACPEWLLDYFSALGIPILEAYGQSENIIPIAANVLAAHKRGTVGQQLHRNEVRVSNEGVIEVKGPGVFLPDLPENKDRPALTRDGYLVTGDLGQLVPGGFLQLTGRRTDVFKAANGRWLSPDEIEAELRRLPYVEQAAVIPRQGGVLIAILVVSITMCPHLRTSESTKVTLELGDAPVMAGIRGDLVTMLTGMNAPMRPHGLLLTPTLFSVDGGELTTNFKLRRAQIERKYESALSSLADELRLGRALPAEPSQVLIRAL